MKLLITCPPMLRNIERYTDMLSSYELILPDVIQTLPESDLVRLLDGVPAWIVGDDQVTRRLLEQTQLKVVIKWGVGVDNIDFDACKSLNIAVSNTPYCFGREVADIAVAYLISLSRSLFYIHTEVLANRWPKPTGVSLTGKKVALIGLGDIGYAVAKRLSALELRVFGSDPAFTFDQTMLVHRSGKVFVPPENFILASLAESVIDADFIVITCDLNPSTLNLINKQLLLTAPGVSIVNVSRGKIVNESDVIELQKSKLIGPVAFDVYFEEPLAVNNELRDNPYNIFGTHNSSNTVEAVDRASVRAVELLSELLASVQAVPGSDHIRQ